VKLPTAFCLIYFLLLIQQSLAGAPAVLRDEGETWECSISAATYVVRNGPEYVNPVFTADRSWLHLEARYNYEALKTGSLWLGYNFTLGDKLVLEATPMLGGVFGNSTGIAPGYTISLSYKEFELFTQGEYSSMLGLAPAIFLYLDRAKRNADGVAPGRTGDRSDEGHSEARSRSVAAPFSTSPVGKLISPPIGSTRDQFIPHLFFCWA